MSEPRIRWEDGGSEMIALCGHVGGLSATVFRILRPWSTFEHWAVSCTLAGSGPVRRGNGPEELKAQAERWLEEFVSSLGAVFRDDPRDSVTIGLSEQDARGVLANALDEYAEWCRVQAEDERDREWRTRWAAIADRMHKQVTETGP